MARTSDRLRGITSPTPTPEPISTPTTPTGGGRTSRRLLQGGTGFATAQTPAQIQQAGPLSFLERARLSFGTEEGKKERLRELGFIVSDDPQGNLLISRDGQTFRVDPKGFDIGDIGDLFGKALPFGASIVGALPGLATGAIPASIIGGAAGGALGETARQAIGGALGVGGGAGIGERAGEVGREALFGGTAGLGAAVTGRVASRLAPEVLRPAATLLSETGVPIATQNILARGVPTFGQRLAGEAVGAGTFGGTFGFGEKLFETGDVGEATKAGAAGFAITAPFGPALGIFNKLGGNVTRRGLAKIEEVAASPQAGFNKRIAQFMSQNIINPVKNVLSSYGKSGKLLADIEGDRIVSTQIIAGSADDPFRLGLTQAVKVASNIELEQAKRILLENKALKQAGAVTAEELILRVRNEGVAISQNVENLLRSTFNTTRGPSSSLASVEARYLEANLKKPIADRAQKIATRENPYFPEVDRRTGKPADLVLADELFANDKQLQAIPISERWGAAYKKARERIEKNRGPAKLGRVSERETVGFAKLGLNEITEEGSILPAEYLGAISRAVQGDSRKAGLLEAYLKSGIKLTSAEKKLLSTHGPEATVNEIRSRIRNQISSELKVAGRELDVGSAKRFIQQQLDILDDFAIDTDITSFIKKLNATKLSFSAVPNAFQSLNTLLATDFPTMFKAFRSLFNEEARARARKAGAQQSGLIRAETGLREEVRRKAVSETAPRLEKLAAKSNPILRKFVDKLLTPFIWVEEKLNRVAAANAGFFWAEKAVKNNNFALLEGLTTKEIFDKAVKSGAFPEEEMLKIMNKFMQKTQFGFNPLEMPALFNTPWGSVFFQFKSFIFRETMFLWGQTIGEIQAGRPGRATKNLLILLTMFPAGGYAIDTIRKVFRGEPLTELDEVTLGKYAEFVGNTGGWGVLGDLWSSIGYDRFLEFWVGPTFSELSEATTILPELAEFISGEEEFPLETVGRLTANRFGGIGSAIRERLTD